MGNAPAETKEFAYTVWCECGQNLSECHRKMNGEHGYVISRQALHEWKEKYNWEARAARTSSLQVSIFPAVLNILAHCSQYKIYSFAADSSAEENHTGRPGV